MKFIYADALDYVDPDFDFASDRTHEDRNIQWDDQYPHEFLERAPYDGILVSRGVVGDIHGQGKYTHAQMMRFRREGARRFMRYAEKDYPGSLIFGDCGAFTYRNEKIPPYTPADTVDFYADGGFSHGCSVDHLIFDFDEGQGRAREQVPDDIRDRFDITLQLAAEFKRESKRLGKGFTPMGVVQGWSAPSMAESARQLVKMGFDYLAIGGMVPLDVTQIHRAVSAVRAAIPSKVRLHLLGFGKIENIGEFTDYGVASFDTTSPLLRAFKDARKNYFARTDEGELSYYTAIRVPQSRDNNKLKAKAKRGVLRQEDALRLESAALDGLRGYAEGRLSVEVALDATLNYWAALNWRESDSEVTKLRALKKQREIYHRTLSDMPWKNCRCRVCREGGVETLIFRTSNRNKRRGIHNLHIFYQHLLSHRLVA
ncbi:hypothetical protein ACVWWJ_000395 [Luteibacter sp. HA06]